MPANPKPKRNRRPIVATQNWQPTILIPNASVLVPYLQIGASVIQTDGTSVVLQQMPMTLSGLPRILKDNLVTVESPTAATITDDGTVISLTFPTQAASGDTIYVTSFDPAIRTRQGGWLAPAQLIV
jgi:hypothetical protein